MNNPSWCEVCGKPSEIYLAEKGAIDPEEVKRERYKPGGLINVHGEVHGYCKEHFECEHVTPGNIK